LCRDEEGKMCRADAPPGSLGAGELRVSP
jgi:hypothetical protein